jgi:hypothetical protein
MTRYMTKGAKMVGVGRQTDISTPVCTPPAGTPGTDYAVFSAEIDIIVTTLAAASWNAGMSRYGARMPPLPGRRGATFKVRMPLAALRTGYVSASEAPGVGVGTIAPMTLLLANALGSACGSPTAAEWLLGTHLSRTDYAGGVITGATTTVITATGVAPSANGHFVATENHTTGDNDSLPQFGWVKSGTVDALTLYEASKNTGGAGDHILGSVTAFLSNNQPCPLTFFVFGPETNSTEMMTGCYCTGGEIDAKIGDQAWVTLDFEAADHAWISGSTNIRSATGAWYPAPPAQKANNGRLTYGTSGTGSATSIEAWKDIKIKWKTPIERMESAAGIQGWGTPGLGIPEVTVTAAIAWDSSDSITSEGDHPLVGDFRSQRVLSLCWSTGRRPGQIVSIFLGAMQHAKAPVPKAGGADGMLWHDIELVPADAATDTPGAYPANSPLRIGNA